jgi:hypothetical protein
VGSMNISTRRLRTLCSICQRSDVTGPSGLRRYRWPSELRIHLELPKQDIEALWKMQEELPVLRQCSHRSASR